MKYKILLNTVRQKVRMRRKFQAGTVSNKGRMRENCQAGAVDDNVGWRETFRTPTTTEMSDKNKIYHQKWQDAR